MDNFFFGEILGNTKQWEGAQMLFSIKYTKGVATVAFNGFDDLPTSQQPVTVNATFYPTFTAELQVSSYFATRQEVGEFVAV